MEDIMGIRRQTLYNKIQVSVNLSDYATNSDRNLDQVFDSIHVDFS